jgi:hypothetical protein
VAPGTPYGAGVILCQEIHDEPIQLKDEITGNIVAANIPAGAAMPFSMTGEADPDAYGKQTPIQQITWRWRATSTDTSWGRLETRAEVP